MISARLPLCESTESDDMLDRIEANDAHEPTFTFYETGFRCCGDPKDR